MDDYISRQAAIEGLKEYFSDEERTETEYGAYWHHIHVLQFLEGILPAGVRPVVRGKWKVEEREGRRYSVCLACDKSFGGRADNGEVLSLDLSGMPFCPNCGADMREERSRDGGE